jgi:hypothetical protein
MLDKVLTWIWMDKPRLVTFILGFLVGALIF